MNRNKILESFLCTFYATLVICIVLLIVGGCEFRNRQNRIVEIYEQHIARQDSIRMTNLSSLSRIYREKEKRIKAMLSDSTINEIPSLCEKQRAAVRNFIKPCWEVTTRELIATDSIKQTPASNSDEKDEIKALLELEFSKIQSEYESLEIWAALITIVFLVFSFYSLFKLERIEDQAMNKVKELGDLNKRATAEIESLHGKYEDYKISTEKSINEILQNSQSKMNQFHDGMNMQANAFKTKMADMLSTNEEELKRLQDIYSKKMEDVDELIATLSEILASQKKQD